MNRDTAMLPRIPLGAIFALLIAGGSAVAWGSPPAAATPARSTAARRDSVPAEDLIQPKDLARLLAAPAARRPTVLHVGFKVLYQGAHITGARYVGPGSTSAGLAALSKVLQPLPRTKLVVLYCGCCPWKECPNVRPAYRTARAMGFKAIKVLFVAKNFQQDWVERGLPFRKGDE